MSQHNGPTAHIPVIEEPPIHPIPNQMAAEVAKLLERLQIHNPYYEPPPFSVEGFLTFIEKVLKQTLPGTEKDILSRLRDAVNQDWFDIETWQGAWYLLDYTVKHQVGLIKRQLTGQYETDEWGLDWEFLEIVQPFLNFLYKRYFRVETTGITSIPDYQRALLVANHSGQIPIDGAMIATAVFNEHATQPILRNWHTHGIPSLPFVAPILGKMGQVLIDEGQVCSLLEQDALVAVYPEGSKGAGKPFKDRYRLAQFEGDTFVRVALKTGTPIIPTAVVGGEETYIALGQSKTLARLLGFPYFPISLRFPWLGLLGLIPNPTKWYIDFGPPITLDEYRLDGNHSSCMTQLTNDIRATIQHMINQRLIQRKSILFG